MNQHNYGNSNSQPRCLIIKHRGFFVDNKIKSKFFLQGANGEKLSTKIGLRHRKSYYI